MTDLLTEGFETFSLVAILLAGLIFTRLAFKAKSLGSFRFQLSFFILIWVVAELPHVASTLGLVSEDAYGLFGLTFHLLSMAAFAIFVGIKSFDFFKPTPPMPPSTSLPTTPVFPVRRSEGADK